VLPHEKSLTTKPAQAFPGSAKPPIARAAAAVINRAALEIDIISSLVARIQVNRKAGDLGGWQAVKISDDLRFPM
jgi:hypothetical protein